MPSRLVRLLSVCLLSVCLLQFCDGDGNQTENPQDLQNQTLNLTQNLQDLHNQTENPQTLNLTQNLQDLHNQTENLQDLHNQTAWGSAHFTLAGVRSFVPEQEMTVRIIGGQEAWAHSWPWQVSLRFASMAACGGAIISPLWVVSAAHCFRRYDRASFWTVLAGKHDLDNPHEVGQQLVGVSTIIKHHAYSSRTKECDVALLKLQQPLMFSFSIRPINIWMQPLPLRRKCTATGWGSTRENGPRAQRLQEVNVTLLPPEVCNRYYHGRIRPSMICAGKDGGGADACQGDSGGPLSCFGGQRYQLAGLVSWGVGCGRARKPGVYTLLQMHTHWMSNVMNSQNVMFADEPMSEGQRCGCQHSSSCPRPPAVAELRGSQDGESRVQGVSEACPSLWPWVVSLQTAGRHYCSAALIHRRWALAARHCGVRAKVDAVVLGLHDLRFPSVQSVTVDQVFDLPQDYSFPPTADLTLLRLSAPATISSSVFPVCVPDEDEELDDSWTCVTAGWGVVKATTSVDPARLHHARLSLVNQTSCREKWGGDLIGDDLMCSHPAGSASCMGDAGAALFCRRRSTYFLFGVMAWGGRSCDASRPAIFSRVTDFRRWISDVTKEV